MTEISLKHVHLVLAACARHQAERLWENTVEDADTWQGHRGSRGKARGTFQNPRDSLVLGYVTWDEYSRNKVPLPYFL